ncbi:hypothetical protein CPB84DRAFT_1799964, partial [Gymnopilus junonius]
MASSILPGMRCEHASGYTGHGSGLINPCKSCMQMLNIMHELKATISPTKATAVETSTSDLTDMPEGIQATNMTHLTPPAYRKGLKTPCSSKKILHLMFASEGGRAKVPAVGGSDDSPGGVEKIRTSSRYDCKHIQGHTYRATLHICGGVGLAASNGVCGPPTPLSPS